MACHNCACGPPLAEKDAKDVNVADHPEQETTVVDCMEDEQKLWQVAMKAAGAQLIEGDGRGLRIAGWSIRTRKQAILKMDARDSDAGIQCERSETGQYCNQLELFYRPWKDDGLIWWEKILGSIHLPEMVFGDNSLELVHEATGIKVHFNALDALRGWRQEALPPVEVPAAAKWKIRTKPNQQVILDYDYTFTTPYSGSQCIESENRQGLVSAGVEWVESQEGIDMVMLQARDPILFFDEVVLYEDELADNGVSLLTAKVRVMPSCWFLLLRFWLRVDGVLMRLRDTRLFCRFQSDSTVVPVVIRESSIKEDTFKALASRGYSSDSAMYNDPSVAGERLTEQRHLFEKLILNSNKT